MVVRGILLVDHGSRNAPANETLEQIARLVREQLPAGAIVGVAHMELAAPGIAEALGALVTRGADEIVVVPYFLAAGRHSTEDIPRMVEEAMRDYPAISYRVARPLGVDPLLAELVIKRAGL